MLYRIPYHTAVVRNADNPATTVPYRTTNSLPIIKGRNSNNLDIGIPAWYGTEPLPRILPGSVPRRSGTEPLQRALPASVPRRSGTERQQDRSKASVPRHSGVQTPTAQSKGSVPYQSSHGHPLLQIRNRGRRLPRATPCPGTDGVRERHMRLALIPVGHARHVVAAFEQTGLIDANLLELDP